jgi:Protein of unknown function (DUF3147)
MIVHAKFSALGESRWYEYLVRFVLGGLTTVVAGVVADLYGPQMGGLFLAFPAIFCASATLIEKHERQRKKERGVAGQRRGTDAAALDASGAALGGIGLAAFALAVWLLAPEYGLASLVIGSIAWILVSVTCWRLRRVIRHSR